MSQRLRVIQWGTGNVGHEALRGQQISDFPLCNKSFDLSYCGFDL